MKKGLMGSELRRERLAAQVTRDELARHSGVAAGVIEAIEAGEREPEIEELFRLAYALGLEADELVGTVWRATQQFADK